MQYSVFKSLSALRVILPVLCTCSTFTLLQAQYNFNKVDKWLSDNSHELGGRTILVVTKNGQIVYTKAVNEMNFRQKAINRLVARRTGKEADLNDYTSTTRQMIASCSKWLSAALVMTFVDEGKLKETDTVGRFLPVLSRAGKGGITISQCLSHLTGIESASLRESLQEMQSINSMDEAMGKIAALPMEGEPGKVFHYSNTGLQIAGAVIEKISGKSFETLFAERIAQPLGMKNTDFGKGKVALPAGGAWSTPEDYMNFLVMIENKGLFNGKRILSEKSVNAMQVNRITQEVKVAYSPAEAGGLGYGYGEWVIEPAAGGAQSKSVSSPGLFGSFPWIDNEQHYCAFLMTFYLNNEGRTARYAALKKLVSEALQ
jgi:CubicO group peptidase (beta-lactamase class C family)